MVRAARRAAVRIEGSMLKSGHVFLMLLHTRFTRLNLREGKQNCLAAVMRERYD